MRRLDDLIERIERSDHGVDPNLINEEGETALHRGCASPQVVRLLLEYNADINRQDNRGFTPLHLAVAIDAEVTARLLVDSGADVTARTQDGQTALDLILEMQFPGYENLASYLKARESRSRSTFHE